MRQVSDRDHRLGQRLRRGEQIKAEVLARVRIWHLLKAPSTMTMPRTRCDCGTSTVAIERDGQACPKYDRRGLHQPARAAAATEPIGEPTALTKECSDPTDGRRCSDRCGKAHGAAEGSEELDPAAPRRSKGSLAAAQGSLAYAGSFLSSFEAVQDSKSKIKSGL